MGLRSRWSRRMASKTIWCAGNANMSRALTTSTTSPMTLLSKIMAPRSAISVSRLWGSRVPPSTSAGETGLRAADVMSPLPRKSTPSQNHESRITHHGRRNFPSAPAIPGSRFARLALFLFGLGGPFGFDRLGRQYPDLELGLDVTVQVDDDLVCADLLDGLGDLDGPRLDLEALILERVGDHARGDRAVEQPLLVGVDLDGDRGDARQLFGDLLGVADEGSLLFHHAALGQLELLVHRGGGDAGELAREEEVSRESLAHVHGLAAAAELVHVLPEQHFHCSLQSSALSRPVRGPGLQVSHAHVREHGHVAGPLHGELGAALMKGAVARTLPRIELALAGAELEEHLQLLVVDNLGLVAAEAAPVVLAELGVLFAAIVAIIAAAAVPFDPGHLDLLFLSADSGVPRTECLLRPPEAARLRDRRLPEQRRRCAGSSRRRPRLHPRDGCRRTARSPPSHGPCSSS